MPTAKENPPRPKQKIDPQLVSKAGELRDRYHDWAHRVLFDPELGEWYGYADRDGRISLTTKGNLCKSAFHHPRMQLRGWRLLAGITGTT